jgi:hypothetical protein
MARKEPYNESSTDKMMLAIFSKRREQLPNNYSQTLKDLVEKCLNTDPE